MSGKGIGKGSGRTGTMVLGFPENRVTAQALADALDVTCEVADLHRFPDGESRVRVPSPAAETVLVYRSLDDPDAKLVELLLAAAALRDNGARQVVLVAPYLAYMRQDMAFRPGEAVSQQVIGRLLATHLDGLITIDPHLHRISRLDEAVPGIPALSLSAASVLAQALDAAENPILIGPDSESAPWVKAIATPLGLEVLVGAKNRHGDRAVSIVVPGIEQVRGRVVVLVDDVIASGRTLAVAAQLLQQAGAARVEALATHCLASHQDLAAMEQAGISRIRATLSVDGPCASLPVAGLLADAIRHQGWA